MRGLTVSLVRCSQITRSGRIVPDKEYKYKLIQRHHQRHARECLAQAIFQKVLEMEVGWSHELERGWRGGLWNHCQLIWDPACIMNDGNLSCAPPFPSSPLPYSVSIKQRSKGDWRSLQGGKECKGSRFLIYIQTPLCCPALHTNGS